MNAALPRVRTALQVMQPAALVAQGEQTAGALRAQWMQHKPRLEPDHANVLCVVDGQQKLLGTVPLGELLTLPDHQRLDSVAHRQWPRVGLEAEQEHVASLALQHHLTAVPVTDSEGRLLGLVGAAALLRILRREHVEDLHHLAGIGHETDQARDALEAPPVRRARHRLPWLIVGLLGSELRTGLLIGTVLALRLHRERLAAPDQGCRLPRAATMRISATSQQRSGDSRCRS